VGSIAEFLHGNQGLAENRSELHRGILTRWNSTRAPRQVWR